MRNPRLTLRRLAIAAVVIVAGSLVQFVATPAQPASAFTGSQFNPGYIVSDANFFNYNSMSAASIQTFLQGQEGGCTAVNGEPCLDSFQMATTNRAASTNGNPCKGYVGAASESASTIIYRVAQACEISPQVILVTLQKEEGLVDSLAPSPAAYKVAMGYGCPDTAACDSTYYGFFNQVYQAAWQFREYGSVNASSRQYHIGNVAVAYSPNTAAKCGAPVVNIQDQATADLYMYTPYQPDPQALANLHGLGDTSCSSYGNRNFWVYWWTWFGDPTGDSGPFGNIDSAYGVTGGLNFAGWAIDPDTTDPINVQISVDGQVMATVLANGTRTDVGATYPDKGSDHGYSGTITGLSDAVHTVCATGINVSFGTNQSLGCVQSLPAVVAAASGSGEQAVYRFYDPATNDHFFTMSVDERNEIIQNYPSSTWTYEGFAFFAFPTQVAGTVPLYRFWSPAYQGHFFTANADEQAAVSTQYPSSIWTYEGVAFYVYPPTSSAADSTSVYRFWSPDFRQHFYTASAAEQAEIVANDPPSEWTYEGINFKVPTN